MHVTVLDTSERDAHMRAQQLPLALGCCPETVFLNASACRGKSSQKEVAAPMKARVGACLRVSHALEGATKGDACGFVFSTQRGLHAPDLAYLFVVFVCFV